MENRISEELNLLRRYYPSLEYQPNGQWVRVPSYPLPENWNREMTDVAFQIPVAFPGTPPYGIYVPMGILYRGSKPNNFVEPAATQPPFTGQWGVFSWLPLDGHWRPTADIISGSNLLNWTRGFTDRFREGL